jgi:hypothetical protein
VGWNWKSSIESGEVTCLISDTNRLRLRLAVMVAGGPLMSLVTGVAAAWLAWSMFVKLDPDRVRVAARFGAGMFAVDSLAAFALSLLPFREGAAFSDGWRLWRLARGGPEWRRDLAYHALDAALQRGVPLGELEGRLVEQATSVPDDSRVDVLSCLIGYYHASARGDEDQARRFVHRFLPNIDLMPQPARKLFYLEGAYFVARHDHDPVAGRELLERVTPESSEMFDRAAIAVTLAEAKSALGDGDANKARRLAEEGMSLLQGCEARGVVIGDPELASELRAFGSRLGSEVPANG